MSGAEGLSEMFPDDDQLRAEAAHPHLEVGRLVEPQSGVDELDTEADPVAIDVGADDGDLSAEEAAMHITENP